MKKKVVSMILALCMVTCLGVATVQADWYTCNVVRAGVGSSSGATYVYLSDTGGAFTNRWFQLDPANAKAHLATALTAASSGAAVQAYFPVSGVPAYYALITALYITQ